MNTRSFEKYALSLFPKNTLKLFEDDFQFGFNNFIDKDIKRIGYAIDLTIDTIEEAKKLHIDLILTHHNVWDEMLEMREDCLELLKKYEIIHYFNHLPLDSVEFGPTRVLANELGVKIVDDICFFEDVSFGVVGEFDEAITLDALKNKLEAIMGHDVRVWKYNDSLIKRVGIVAGSGGNPIDMHDALLLRSDAYITGEKKLKTLLYAKHVKLNFLLGSHTFTEVGGMHAFTEKLKEKMNEVEFIHLSEHFIE